MDPDIKNAALYKLRLKESIANFLYNTAHEKLQLRLEALIIRNTVLIKSGHKSFAYKGELYSIDSSPMPQRRNRLVPDLNNEMETYLKYMKAIAKEQPEIMNYVSQVLNSSNWYGDYLKMFPECIKPAIRDFCKDQQARNDKILDPIVQALNERNQQSITRIKERLVTNLIL